MACTKAADGVTRSRRAMFSSTTCAASCEQTYNPTTTLNFSSSTLDSDCGAIFVEKATRHSANIRLSSLSLEMMMMVPKARDTAEYPRSIRKRRREQTNSTAMATVARHLRSYIPNFRIDMCVSFLARNSGTRFKSIRFGYDREFLGKKDQARLSVALQNTLHRDKAKGRPVVQHSRNCSELEETGKNRVSLSLDVALYSRGSSTRTGSKAFAAEGRRT